MTSHPDRTRQDGPVVAEAVEKLANRMTLNLAVFDFARDRLHQKASVRA